MTSFIRMKSYCFFAWLVIIGLSFLFSPLKGENQQSNGTIVFVSSYNSDSPNTIKYVNDFEEEYFQNGGKYITQLRSMNCQSFSEASSWVRKMGDIITEEMAKTSIKLVVLLGQEAWAAYFSLDSALVDGIPVMGAMVSRNGILLPDDEIGDDWEPETIDVMTSVSKRLSISGFAYEYDVETNVRMILDFFPETKHIALITDNSYGGVSLQAYVKQEMKKFPEQELILLDGRKKELRVISEEIERLPSNTVLLLGTWRVDGINRLFTKFPAYDLLGERNDIPAFTLTSLGMKYGVIGGYSPEYMYVGKEMAQTALALEENEKFWLEPMELQFIPNRYSFDYKMLSQYGFEDKKEVKGAYIYNPKNYYLKEYRYEIVTIVIVFVILLMALLLSQYVYFRTKRLKNALEEIQKDNRLILNNVNVGIKFINPDYTVKWHNGIDFDTSVNNIVNSINKICYKHLRGLNKPCDYCPITKVRQEGKAQSQTVRFQSGKDVLMFANSVYDTTGELMGYVMRLEDVTEQKRTEMELRLAKEKAEESDQLKSAFLANMSHEIRTPLNAIVGFSGVLVSDECDESMRQEYVGIIQKNSDLLLHLINDILDISRLETGRLKLVYGEYDIVDICKNVLATTAHAQPAGVEYRFEPAPESLLIKTDIQRLRQVLINLVSNANKFTTSGYIDLKFWVQDSESRIYFSVTDTGCGIPEGDEEKIFGRFEKLNEYAQGTGLGLAISKIIVDRLGGEIWVDRDYKEGARFVFWQPL